MKIATASTSAEDTRGATEECFAALQSKLGGAPNLILAHFSVAYDAETLAKVLHERAPDCAVLGGTSFGGVMNEVGFCSLDDRGMVLFAVHDPDGDYGAAVAQKGDSPAAAAQDALYRAIERADREGENPAIVLIATSPGGEEDSIAGIADVVGNGVPVLGGSTADAILDASWKQFADGEVIADGVALAVLYPSGDILTAFHSGYEPTDHRGTVTKGDGRLIHEIDGRPAARVYDEWTNNALKQPDVRGSNLIAVTAMHPIGRPVGEIEGITYYGLSHLVEETADEGLIVYTRMNEGDAVVLMTGSKDSLVGRAPRLVQTMLENAQWSRSNVAGVFLVFCAGCMMSIRDRLPEVTEGMNAVLEGIPFAVTFTYGEQACAIG